MSQSQENFRTKGWIDPNSQNPSGHGQAVTDPGRLGDRYTSLGVQNLTPENTFQIFLFQLYFNKKYVEAAINDLKMHLVISKWVRRQKCRQKRKTIRKKVVEVKEKTVYESVFIHLNTYFLLDFFTNLLPFIKWYKCFV